MANNEIAQMNDSVVDTEKAMALLSGDATSVLSSFDMDTDEGKMQTMDAVTNAENVSEHLGETINLRNFVAQAVEVADRQTGELSPAVRLILVDDKGGAYAAVSGALLKSVQNIVGIFGQPRTWANPIPIRVEKVKGRNGDFYTARLAPEGVVKK